jgi:hypothetical protein
MTYTTYLTYMTRTTYPSNWYFKWQICSIRHNPPNPQAFADR